MKLDLDYWKRRIGNARKHSNSEKGMAYQVARTHEEVSEMFMEHRKGGDLRKITYKDDKDGIPKPYGFAAEWGDAMNQLLHIADLEGIDVEAALEAVTSYHEARRVRLVTSTTKKKSKKGKKK